MNAEKPTSVAPDDSARRSAVAGFVDSLTRRLRGAPSETALPEQIEATVRQVQPNVAAGLHASRTEDDAAADVASAQRYLADRFAQAATSIGVQVHPAAISDWPDVVAGVLQQHRARTVVLPPVGDGLFDANRVEQLKERLATDGVTAKSGADDETLFSVDAAVTGVVVAIAENGTIVCESGRIVARGSSLIPPIHIAVIEVAQLLPDLYDCLRALGDRSNLPANVSIITGPSKTADIEGVLVTGVHGPGVVHVVLVRDR